MFTLLLDNVYEQRWSKYDQNTQQTLLNIIKLLCLIDIYNLLSVKYNTME